MKILKYYFLLVLAFTVFRVGSQLTSPDSPSQLIVMSSRENIAPTSTTDYFNGLSNSELGLSGVANAEQIEALDFSHLSDPVYSDVNKAIYLLSLQAIEEAQSVRSPGNSEFSRYMFNNLSPELIFSVSTTEVSSYFGQTVTNLVAQADYPKTSELYSGNLNSVAQFIQRIESPYLQSIGLSLRVNPRTSKGTVISPITGDRITSAFGYGSRSGAAYGPAQIEGDSRNYSEDNPASHYDNMSFWSLNYYVIEDATSIKLSDYLEEAFSNMTDLEREYFCVAVLVSVHNMGAGSISSNKMSGAMANYMPVEDIDSWHEYLVQLTSETNIQAIQQAATERLSSHFYSSGTIGHLPWSQARLYNDGIILDNSKINWKSGESELFSGENSRYDNGYMYNHRASHVFATLLRYEELKQIYR